MTQLELLAHVRAAFVGGKRSANPDKQARASIARAVLNCETLPHEPEDTCRVLRGIVPEASASQLVYLVRRAHAKHAAAEVTEMVERMLRDVEASVQESVADIMAGIMADMK